MDSAAATAATAATAPFRLGVPVPSLLWDTFEEALRLNVKRLVKDISTTLSVSDAPLLNAVLKGASVRPYLFEESDDSLEVDLRCDHLCQRPEAPLFLQPCRQPVVWTGGAAHKRCAEHLYAAAAGTQLALSRLPILTPLEFPDTDEALYVKEDGVVVNAKMEARGRYEKEGARLFLFEVGGEGAEGAEGAEN